MTAWPATAWAGRQLGEVLPQMDIGLIERPLRQMLATGKPAADFEVTCGVLGPDGDHHATR